jgi:imidazolonepropionase-like amidohydrolase
MKQWRYTVAVVGLSFLLAYCSPQSRTASGVVVLEGATVIDGVSSAAIEDAVLVVEGDRIRSVGTRGSVEVPSGATRINAAGKTILPGLISLHGHVGRTEGIEANEEYFNRARIERDADAYLYYGLTHVLSLGHDREAIFEFLADQRAGKTTGARLYTAGLGFGAKNGWPANPYVHRPTSAEEAREMAQGELANRPGFLKLWVDDRLGQSPAFPPEVYGPIIEEARQQGVRVTAHVYYLADANELMRRGVAALAHSVQDREVDEEFLRLAKQNDVVQILTLSGIRKNVDYVENPDFLADAGLRVLFPAPVLQVFGSKAYRDGLAKQFNLDLIRRQSEVAAKNAKKIADAGIPIAVGTDSGLVGSFPGLWEHRELELLVEAGLTPMQALQAATITGARFLGVDRDYGSLEPGKVADFVILSANPLADMTRTRQMEAVWMNGKQVDRSALASAAARPAAAEKK